MFKKPSFGLDISDYSIEVLQLKKRGKILAFARIIIEQGIVNDGKILNKEKLTEKIKEVITKAKIRASRVVLSLPESRVFIHIFKLPSITYLEEEAKKIIPLESEKIYFDFQVISKTKDKQEILYVATLKEIVDSYQEVLDKAGFEPIVFDIESAALGRALLRNLKLKTNAMIVDIGARTTNISIFDKNLLLRLSAIVPVAGNQWTQAIAQKLKVSLLEAEKLKRKCGLDPEKSAKISSKFRQTNKAGEEKEGGRVLFVLQKEIQPIIEKIKEAIEYYGQKIEKIFLVGGSAKTPKIADYFSANLDLEVVIGKSSLLGQLKKKFARHRGFSGVNTLLFNTVIGSALRASEKNPQKGGINLLPQTAKPKLSLVEKRTREKVSFRILSSVFGILALFFLFLVIYNYIINPPPTDSGLRPTGIEKLPPEGVLPAEEIIPEEELEPEKIPTVTIGETSTGWLRVRGGPGTAYPEITKVYPGESYPQLEEFKGWYKIELKDGRQGWISAKYTLENE